MITIIDNEKGAKMWVGGIDEFSKSLKSELSKSLKEDIISVLQENLAGAESKDSAVKARDYLEEAQLGRLGVKFTRYSKSLEWEIYWAYCLRDEDISDEKETLWAKGSPEKLWKYNEIFED